MTVADLHYRLDGPPGAPVVVLSNSLGTDLTMWDPQAAALATHFRVLRYDHRGHGGSPVPEGPYDLAELAGDVLALLDRLGLERVHFCGLSLGGMVGMWLAAHAPDRIGKLVLCCTAARLGPADRWLERAATVRAHGTGAVADASVGRWFTPEFIERDPERVRQLRRMVARTPPEGYAACCEALASMDLEPILATIKAPTLVLAGANDPSTPPDHAHAIAAAIPSARVVVLEQAAHLANLEQAEAVTTAVLDYLHDPIGATMGGQREDGMTVRREVLGDDHVDRAISGTTAFSAPFQDFITRYAWAEVWRRPGLDRRTRSCITLAVLTALRCEDEIGMHVRAALRNGLTPAEISEVLMHTAVYAGAPAANTAFAIAQRSLAELGVDEAQPSSQARSPEGDE